MNDAGDEALELGPERRAVLGRDLDEVLQHCRIGQLAFGDNRQAREFGREPTLVILDLAFDADDGAFAGKPQGVEAGIVTEDRAAE